MKKNINSLIRMGAAMVLLAFPSLGHATVYTWNVSSGDPSVSGNWSPTATFSSTNSDNYQVKDGGTLTLSGNTLNVANSLFVLGNPSSAGGYADDLQIVSGGSLSVMNLRTDSQTGLQNNTTTGNPTSVEVGSSSGSSGTLTVGSGGIQVGQYNTATLTIYSGGSVSVASSTSIVGQAGSSYNSADKGAGTITNYGSFTDAGAVNLGEEGASGTFINNGGTTSVVGLGNNASTLSGSSGTLEIVGHAGSLTDSGGLAIETAGNETGTLEWVLDSQGIAPINLTGGSKATITGATLEFNLDAVAATLGTYTLITTNAGITDSFGTSEILSNSLGSNSSLEADVFVSGNNLDLTVMAVPEPSSYGLMGLGLLALFILRLRRRAAAL